MKATPTKISKAIDIIKREKKIDCAILQNYFDVSYNHFTYCVVYDLIRKSNKSIIREGNYLIWIGESEAENEISVSSVSASPHSPHTLAQVQGGQA